MNTRNDTIMTEMTACIETLINMVTGNEEENKMVLQDENSINNLKM